MFNSQLLRRSSTLLTNLILAIWVGMSHANTLDAYREGKLAFGSGEYSAALAFFLQAEREGNGTASLTYNIGVTHFKLGNREQAKVYFKRLLPLEKWRAVAEINLGVIARAEGDEALSNVFFRDALQQTDSDKLKALILHYLGESDEPKEPEADNPISWTRLASLSYGYDENPALVRDDLDIAGVQNHSDRYTEGVAFLGAKIRTKPTQAWHLGLTGYSRNLASSDELDFVKYAAHTRYAYDTGKWTLTPGAELGHATLDNSQYLRDISLTFEAAREFKSVDLFTTLKATHNQGGSRFRFLDGSRYSLKLGLRGSIMSGNGPAGQWQIAYRYEQNNRDDIDTSERFISFSPQRSYFEARLQFDLTERLITGFQAMRRDSHYPDAIRITSAEGESVVAQKRNDELLSLRWFANYRFTDRLRSIVSLRYLENSSTLSAYEYDSAQATAGFEYAF